MKILVLGLRSIGVPASGGIERVVEELSVRYAAKGHDVTVACRSRYVEGVARSVSGVKIKAVPAIYTKHLEAISNTLFALPLCLGRFDIVHIHATGPALLSFVPRALGRRTVVTVHGLDWKREKWGGVASLVLRMGAWAAGTFPHRTIVVSRSLQRHYKQSLGIPVDYIPNGISLPSDTGDRALESGVSELTPGGYFLFLGRLVPEKQCHILIQAFRLLDTEKKLVIAGEQSHSEAYVESLQELAAGDARIVFPGPLYGADKDLAYRNAYAFVLPSTIEGMAISLLEAMSYGKCCLCSDIEENLEVIQSVSPCGDHHSMSTPTAGAIGIDFQTGNVEALRARLNWLLDNPLEVARLGREAKAHVARSFDWDRIADQHLVLYRSLI